MRVIDRSPSLDIRISELYNLYNYKYCFFPPTGSSNRKEVATMHNPAVPPSGYTWGDHPWLTWRAAHPAADHPVNIYELHLTSWRRTGDGQLLSCREIVPWLVPYVKQMGFTHVEFLPLTAHLPDDPLGYRCTDYFAMDDRLGTPGDLMYLVDQLHRAGIGVILDWAFPCTTPEEGEAQTCAALFWLSEYHLDGLRLGAAHDWTAQLVQTVSNAHPDVLLIAADHSPGALRWDRELPFRAPDAAAPSQPVLLALSHDEVSKSSLLCRMPGSDEEKYAGLRSLHTLTLARPGKQLLMMGSEFGQWNPWRCQHSLDWHLLDQPDADGECHRRLQAFFRAANDFYLKSPALWQLDFSPDGFHLLQTGEITALLRADREGDALLAVVNHTPVHQEEIRIGVPVPGRYEEAFSSDRVEYGGKGRHNSPADSQPIPRHEMEQSISIQLPPLSAAIFQCKALSIANAIP